MSVSMDELRAAVNNPETRFEQLLPDILQACQHACRTASPCKGPKCSCAVLAFAVQQVHNWQPFTETCRLEKMVKDMPYLAFNLMQHNHTIEAVWATLPLHRE